MIARRRFVVGVLAAASMPLSAKAHQVGKMPRIGVLWHAASAAEEHPYFEALLEGFRNLGYGEGRIVLEHRFPNERPELFASMAAELVSSKPDVLIGVGGAAPYLVKATATIPIVFMYVPDPVGSQLVESIRRPGRNATGLTNFSLTLCAKRLEFLKEIVPTLARVALLVNPSAKISDLYIEQSHAAGPQLGLTTQAFPVRALPELEGAFDAMVEAGMQAVVVNAESLFYQGKDKIAQLAVARRLPTCVWVRELVEVGALVSYGADQHAIARRVPVYVEKILQGAKPAELPVEQPMAFELILNFKTAKALGITMPPSLLILADEVIR